jgi:DNA primase
VTAPPVDVHTYYRQVTDVDIGEIARELLGSRITQESREKLFCDCPNHRSQSHRSLHVWLDRQGWYCHGCGVGGDVLQLVEFVRYGVVTSGQSGCMPESHRLARDFLAERLRLPLLSKLASGSVEAAEDAHGFTLRVREALTALADLYHHRLVGNPEVLAWFKAKYGISDETIDRLKIGYADNSGPSVARTLMEGPGAFTLRELTATSAFRPTAQDGVIPFFDRRIVFPYWSRGRVVFMIGRRTPWTPDQVWEKAKYKKLAVRNERDHEHVAPCIQNDVLYNEDVLLTRPERVVITEGVTDCISLMEHGFAAVSPVTVQIREADWERLLPKLRGVKTVYICQDNEVSEAGMQGALKTARILAGHGIATRVAVLPLGEKQRAAREKLAALASGSAEADELLADAKIDVNEFFASGKTAAEFETILAAAQTPLEIAISRLSPETPDADLVRLLEPILAEVNRLDPLDQHRYIRLIQSRCGKARIPVATLRKQLKVVELNADTRRKYRGGRSAPQGDSTPEGQSRELPSIQVNNRQLRDVLDDTWRAIARINGDLSDFDKLPYFLFQRQGALVRLVPNGSEGALEIEMAQDSAVFALLVHAANWIKVTEEAVLQVHPPHDLARVMMSFPHRDLPALEAVIRTPVFGRSGQLIREAGYHRDERVWLQPREQLDLSSVPETPGPDDVAAARELLFNELLGDFPFVSRSDAAHAVAAMILPFVRRLFHGPTPIHLIEAPRPGSGKGLLANVISVVAHGTTCETKTLPGDEEEVRKLLTTELVKGRPLVLLDNADERKPIQSGVLASVTTAEIWGNRQLGKLDSVCVPNLALWLMTANNPKLAGEMARRCIRIRIDPKIDRPWKRGGFRHEHLLDWARENRARLVHAVIVLVKAWLSAGRPEHHIRLGSFERWSSVVGGIVQAAGIPGFLESLDELYDASDTEGQEWRAFVEAWWQAFGEEPKKVAELNEFCERENLMLGVRGDRGEKSQQIRLGQALNSHRDQVYERYRIVRVVSPRQHRGTAMYTLQFQECANAPDLSGCRDVVGMFEDQHPDTLSPIQPICCGEVSGWSGCLPGISMCGIENHTISEKEEKEREKEKREEPETAQTSRPSRHVLVNESNERTSGVGMFAPNIPTGSIQHPDIPTESPGGRIDLADFEEPDR